MRMTISWLGSFAVLGAMQASLSAAAEEPINVDCGGWVAAGDVGVCEGLFFLPHFTAQDSVDEDSLVASFAGALTKGWSVRGEMRDASDRFFFGWHCEAAVTLPGTSVQVGCGLERPAIYNEFNEYEIDTSGALRVRVQADAELCTPDLPRTDCRFDAVVPFVLAG